MCVPLYAGTCIHKFLYMQVSVYTSACICRYLYTHVPVYARTYRYIHLYTHVSVYARTCNARTQNTNILISPQIKSKERKQTLYALGANQDCKRDKIFVSIKKYFKLYMLISVQCNRDVND